MMMIMMTNGGNHHYHDYTNANDGVQGDIDPDVDDLPPLRGNATNTKNTSMSLFNYYTFCRIQQTYHNKSTGRELQWIYVNVDQ